MSKTKSTRPKCTDGPSSSTKATTVKVWFVYIVRCSDRTLYTGIAINVAKRVTQHNGTNMCGAKYTRTRQPVELVWSTLAGSQGDALRFERHIKKLSREQKEKLIREPGSLCFTFTTPGDRPRSGKVGDATQVVGAGAIYKC